MAVISIKNKIKSGSLLVGNTPFELGDFESIATTTLTSSTATITLSSIPSTYTHLQLRFMGKTNRPTFRNDSLAIQFNGDTSTAYRSHQLLGDGSGTEANAFEFTRMYYQGNIGSTVMSGSTYGVSIVDILDYANVNKNTTTRVLSGWDDNGSGIVSINSGLWFNTAAVNSITLRQGEGTAFAAGTTAALYGIKG